jgi:hypothetical protein
VIDFDAAPRDPEKPLSMPDTIRRPDRLPPSTTRVMRGWAGRSIWRFSAAGGKARAPTLRSESETQDVLAAKFIFTYE